MTDEMCHCGRPLHYSDPAIQQQVQNLVDGLGSHVIVQVEGKAWFVQRHYIALHGLNAADLPALDFEKVLRG